VEGNAADILGQGTPAGVGGELLGVVLSQAGFELGALVSGFEKDDEGAALVGVLKCLEGIGGADKQEAAAEALEAGFEAFPSAFLQLQVPDGDAVFMKGGEPFLDLGIGEETP